VTAAVEAADVAVPQYFDFGLLPPAASTAAGSGVWRVRGQNFTLEYCAAAAGEELTHLSDVEHVLLSLDDDAQVSVATGQEQADVAGAALVVVPLGSSRVIAGRPGRLVRLFDIREADVAETALNAAAYAEPHPGVAPLAPRASRERPGRVRVHRLADHPPAADRFGTVIRSSSFMVNFLDPQVGPRDPDKLSPHHHDDFEQCSLAVDGEWVHHVRTPWGPRRRQWRADEHHAVGSPSVTIIPPPTVHTSEAVGSGLNRLIDIFCPPRADFAQRGWVLNADEYTEAAPS
jgi:hypothetical protein